MSRPLCFGRIAALFLVYLTSLHLTAGDTLTFRAETPISGDRIPVTLTLTDTDAGVQVALSVEPGTGDLLGLFGNVSDEALLAEFVVDDPDSMIFEVATKANKVSRVGGGNNVNPIKNWDYGFKFGRQGSADGPVESVTFSLYAPGLTAGHLAEELNENWLFGVRIQCTLGGEGSSKMGIGPDDLQTPDNTAPVITSEPVTEVIAGQTWTYQILAEDADNDPLSYTVSQGPDGMSVDADGQVSWLPETAGTATVSLTVSDGQDEATQKFELTIAPPPNTPPVITSEPVTAAVAGQTWTYQILAEDADNDPLSYTVSQGPDGMSVDADGQVSWLPETAGTATVSLTVDDGQEEVTQQFELTITPPPNAPPVLLTETLPPATLFAPYTHQLETEDPDGDALTYQLLAAPAGLILEDGLVAWVPLLLLHLLLVPCLALTGAMQQALLVEVFSFLSNGLALGLALRLMPEQELARLVQS